MGKSNDPTKTALRFLEMFCPRKLYEGIEGDLLEQFYSEEKIIGSRMAGVRLWLAVFRFFRPGIILRNTFSLQLISIDMFRNYLTIAFRNVRKNKVFTAINVFGLGIGLAACFLIVQFVMFELSYDKFHDNYERVYRITNDRFQHGKLIQHGTIMYPTIGPAMAKDFPEVEAYSRLMPSGDLNVKADDRIFRGETCHFADEHFFYVFSFPFLAGDRTNALKERHSMVLSETTAKKYFQITDGNYKNAIGKVVYWGLDTQPYKITGIFEDIPENSHIQFDALVSYATLISPDEHDADDSWTWSDMRHYLLLKPGVNYKTLESKFEDFSQRHFQGDKVSGSVEKFFLQPLKDAHLYSDYEYDIAKTANGKAVWALLIVAGFIMVIAWINYINLTTSRALERAKEVGLRKVMGAFRSQLVKQFIFESVLISLFAFIVALLITYLAQSSFNQIIDGNLTWWMVFTNISTSSTLLIISILIVGVLLSGFYPAVVLSSYRPITVLKGKFQRSSSGTWLRKGLVIFQFMASVTLITGTIIVSRQLEFMNKADLGININNTLIVESPENTQWDSTFIERVESYKSELMEIPGVISATTSNNIPGARLGRAFNVRLGEQSESSNVTMSFLGVDYNWFKTYGVPLVEGRTFSTTDHNHDFEKLTNIVMNVSGIQLLGIKDPKDAIGRTVSFWGKTWTLIGVVADYHQQSLKRPKEAMVFFPAYSSYYPTSIKIQQSEMQNSITSIEATFKKFFPGNSFQYTFLEERFNNQYRDDNRFSTIVSIFTVLAIIISCLGLIGLSSYTALQRTKEIGVRKVLGASVVSIVSLLSIDFLKLILIAALLALPLAYYASVNWLETYAYRIGLGVIMFLAPVIAILFIAAITMSVQVIKTAMTNPGETLKHE